MSIRKINFNGGPAALPPDVLQEASDAVRNYKNTGYSILELPHRSPEFFEIIEESKALVKELCDISNDYEVIWVQGGGRAQFAMLPMNYLTQNDIAGYFDSGHWASDAIEYARYYGKVDILGSSKNTTYNQLPEIPSIVATNLKYVHITTNNTIYGTQYHQIPHIDAPLVADMSSDIFSCSRDYSRYAMFYAAAQKNLGTPGVALVVLHKDFLNNSTDAVPPIFSYKAYVKENSVLNTANVSGIYFSLLMLRWIKARGVAEIEKENKLKANLLYDMLDNSKIFTPYIADKDHRSLMNVCFTANSASNEQAFLDLCNNNDIVGIAGHRSVGGFRVSLYNAITIGAVETLVALMQKFETKV